jgi:uncharacterized Zn-finger protein
MTDPTIAWRIAHPETFVVTTRRVSCDGGGGALGHPRVWYDMGDADFAECGYCDRLFALKGGSRDPGAAPGAPAAGH